LDAKVLDLIATVVACCEAPPAPGPRHPRAETVRVLAGHPAALRAPGRALAQPDCHARAGTTLRRTLERRAHTGLLARVHATLVALLRSDPTLIVDSGSVRARRGGELVGPNPTDRAKMGTKCHVAVNGDGTPVACVATRANVADTLLFERLFLRAFAVMARIRTAFADRGYDAESNRALCRRFGVEPCIPKRRQPHGAGLGSQRWPVERTSAWLLENRRLALRYDRLGFIVQSVFRAACLVLVAGKLAREF